MRFPTFHPWPQAPRGARRGVAPLALAGLLVLGPGLLGLVGCSDTPGTYETTPRPVTAVTLNKTTLALAPGGDQATLTATLTPADASTPGLTWSSSDTAVATVANGVVTSVGVGSCTIKATSVDTGVFGACQVTVAPIAVTGVSLDRTTLSMVLGDPAVTLAATVAPANATNRTVTWSSSDTGVATVVNGAVTPVAVGTATITATTADGGRTATCAVTVTSRVVAVTGIGLDKSTLALGPGSDAILAATVAPADATNPAVTWTTSDAAVATVTAGSVHAVALGTATITATTTDGGFTATCAVTVSPTFYGFAGTGQVYAKLGETGEWSQVNSGASGAALGLVISADGQTFFGITNAATNGALWQLDGPAGTWSNVSTATASGTMKAACYDGTHFYGFTGSGKYNAKDGPTGTWAASNLGGTTGFAIIAVTFDGTTFTGFQADGSAWTNTPAQVITANTWTVASPATAGATLVSVIADGRGTFYGMSADGQLYRKTGLAGTWSAAGTQVAPATLVAVVYR